MISFRRPRTSRSMNLRLLFAAIFFASVSCAIRAQTLQISPTRILNDESAAIRADLPEITPAWHWTLIQPIAKRPIYMGGAPKGDANSSLDAIPKVLAFLRQSLASQVVQQ